MQAEIRTDFIHGVPAVIAKISSFNLTHTFESGQCFRWELQQDGSYTGVVGDKVLNVSTGNGEFIFKNTDINTFKDFWYDYFDFGRDYDKIKQQLSYDPVINKAANFGFGIRILRQDIWEILISFIVSANNRIPMIMRIVNNLSRQYGREICKGFYAFPKPVVLAGLSLNELETCRAGFRCKYIKQAAEMVVDKRIDLYGLKYLSTEEARSELQKIPGVGEKIADCVLLYSGTKYDVFPIDLWIKRAIQTLYIGNNASLKDMREFCKAKFRDLAGFAQMYLFYYARLNRIGT